MMNAYHIDEGYPGIEMILSGWEMKNGHIEDKIISGECVHCGKTYSKNKPIMYATTRTGKVVWWCRFGCKKHD